MSLIHTYQLENHGIVNCTEAESAICAANCDEWGSTEDCKVLACDPWVAPSQQCHHMYHKTCWQLFLTQGCPICAFPYDVEPHTDLCDWLVREPPCVVENRQVRPHFRHVDLPALSAILPMGSMLDLSGWQTDHVVMVRGMGQYVRLLQTCNGDLSIPHEWMARPLWYYDQVASYMGVNFSVYNPQESDDSSTDYSEDEEFRESSSNRCRKFTLQPVVQSQ